MQKFNPLRPLPEMTRPLVVVGHSAAMQRIEQEVAVAAESNVTVLIAGESGVGRRLIARTIHDRGSRHAGPFVSVNCICLPDARLESELFGDASNTELEDVPTARGRLAAAHGGTLVLQDVGYLSWRLQGRLLRHTDARELPRWQPGRPASSDARLIAITHRRLVHAVTNQLFRDDLFYRMNVIHIEVPPLRERTDDVSSLLRYFVCLYTARLGRPVLEFTSDALNCLIEYDWPGNVRELREVSEGLARTHTSERVGVDDLPAALVRRSMSRTVARWGSSAPALTTSVAP